jgi:prophage regulatory protein
MEPEMTDKLLRRREVLQKIGISRSTLDRLMNRGQFPRPVEIGAKVVAWRESDVETWISALRPAAILSEAAASPLMRRFKSSLAGWRQDPRRAV